jgi:hypothetical protein
MEIGKVRQLIEYNLTFFYTDKLCYSLEMLCKISKFSVVVTLKVSLQCISPSALVCNLTDLSIASKPSTITDHNIISSYRLAIRKGLPSPSHLSLLITPQTICIRKEYDLV